MKRDQRGFTLMELMIVIVIIGVLAAIGIPAYNNYVDRARRSACDANKRTVETAVGLYYADYGEYPIDGTKPEALVDAVNSKPYIDNADSILCPSTEGEARGTYTIVQEKDTEGNVTGAKVKCSIHDKESTPTS